MKRFIKKKNFKVLKAIDDNNLGSLVRVFLSSFVVIIFFYTIPIIINFTNNILLAENKFLVENIKVLNTSV